jgi:hypothetical protein
MTTNPQCVLCGLKFIEFCIHFPLRLHGLVLSSRTFKLTLTIETSLVVYLSGFTFL